MIDNIEEVIFAHIAQNAGTSILEANKSLKHLGHVGLTNIEDDASILCVLRDPMERLLSSIKYAKLEESKYHKVATLTEHPDYKICQSAGFNKIAMWACINTICLPLTSRKIVFAIRKIGINIPILAHPGFKSQISTLRCPKKLKVTAININRINDAIHQLSAQKLIALNPVRVTNQSIDDRIQLNLFIRILIYCAYFKDYRLWTALRHVAFIRFTTPSVNADKNKIVVGSIRGPIQITFSNWWSDGRDTESKAIIHFLRISSPKQFLRVGSIFRDESQPNFEGLDVIVTFENMKYNRPELLPLINSSKAAKIGYIGTQYLGNWLFRSAKIFDAQTTLKSIPHRIHSLLSEIEAKRLSSIEERDFCCLVSRHDNLNQESKSNACGMRSLAFHSLSALGNIDASGNLLRNSTKLQDEFNDDINKYYANFRFVISFENSISAGYITEKIWDALIAGCIPIYYGPELPRELFTGSGIVFFNSTNPTDSMHLLQKLQNDAAYMHDFRRKPIFAPNAVAFLEEELKSAMKACATLISASNIAS
jgi:hypothetical protein